MSNATATLPRFTETTAQATPAFTRSSTAAPEQGRPLVTAALFCGTLAVGLAALAIAPMLMNHEYANALLLTPLALAAGTCFGGILSLVVFFDEKA